MSRAPCKHKQLSESRAPLAGSRRHFHPHKHVGKVALQGRLQPWLPRLLLPDAAPEMSRWVLSSCCPCSEDGNKSQGTPGCKGPANQQHACVGHSFHTALSPGLKLVHGTEGREEEEGECRSLPSAAAPAPPRPAFPAPGMAASWEGGCVIQ